MAQASVAKHPTLGDQITLDNNDDPYMIELFEIMKTHVRARACQTPPEDRPGLAFFNTSPANVVCMSILK